MAPKQTDPQFKLRMTPGIKDAIELAAAQNNRSMNAEILARLESSFHGAEQSKNSGTLFADIGEERLRKLEFDAFFSDLPRDEYLAKIIDDASAYISAYKEAIEEANALDTENIVLAREIEHLKNIYRLEAQSHNTTRNTLKLVLGTTIVDSISSDEKVIAAKEFLSKIERDLEREVKEAERIVNEYEVSMRRLRKKLYGSEEGR